MSLVRFIYIGTKVIRHPTGNETIRLHHFEKVIHLRDDNRQQRQIFSFFCIESFVVDSFSSKSIYNLWFGFLFYIKYSELRSRASPWQSSLMHRSPLYVLYLVDGPYMIVVLLLSSCDVDRFLPDVWNTTKHSIFVKYFFYHIF